LCKLVSVEKEKYSKQDSKLALKRKTQHIKTTRAGGGRMKKVCNRRTVKHLAQLTKTGWDGGDDGEKNTYSSMVDIKYKYP